MILAAVDYTGIAALISSLATFVVAFSGVIMSFNRARTQDKKLDEIHALGNSSLEKATATAEALGIERGKVIGARNERANPLHPDSDNK